MLRKIVDYSVSIVYHKIKLESISLFGEETKKSMPKLLELQYPTTNDALTSVKCENSLTE